MSEERSCENCYYFVDGPYWDEAVCVECTRLPSLTDNWKPRPDGEKP